MLIRPATIRRSAWRGEKGTSLAEAGDVVAAEQPWP
jgi:hypothetical protein